MPEGADSVAVQDLFDVWHDAQVADGTWLCVLPHASQGPRPPVVFRDAAGAQIQPPPEDQPGWSFGFGVSAAARRDDRGAEEQERRELLARMTVEPRDGRSLPPVAPYPLRGRPVVSGSLVGAGLGSRWTPAHDARD
jgi:hypothetical protein